MLLFQIYYCCAVVAGDIMHDHSSSGYHAETMHITPAMCADVIRLDAR